MKNDKRRPKTFEEEQLEYAEKARHLSDLSDEELKAMVDSVHFLYTEGDLRAAMTVEYSSRFGNWDAVMLSLLDTYVGDFLLRDKIDISPERFETLYIMFYEMMNHIAKLNGTYTASNEVRNRRRFATLVREISGIDMDAFFKL